MQGIKIYPNTKIYIPAPLGMRSGGPTLLYQLASAIIKNSTGGGGAEPQILHYDLGWKNSPDDAYSEYHIKIAQDLQDTPENIMIIPEASTEFLYLCKNVQKIIWWMSVDNYAKSLALAYLQTYTNKLFVSKPIIKKFNFTDNEEISHLVQSRYALDFLRLNNVPEERIQYLSDYLEPVFLQKAKNTDIAKKEPIVAYNPKKGLEFTQKIMAFAPNIKFIPIENMTAAEVEELLSRAMVYIDFGEHPGKDRIPREAAISGAAVITGKRGSAANDEDVPISAEFKFNDDEAEIPNIVKKIEEIFEDFSTYHAKFEKYREIILNEPEKFNNDVINVFNLKPNNEIKTVAFLQSGERGKVLKQVTEREQYLKAIFRLGEEGDEDLEDIEKISFDDALFLYSNGRIEKFVAFVLNDDEKEIIIGKLTDFGVSANDIIFAEVKR